MDADFRAERRRFILAAHPDRGGDAAEFAAGLRYFDDQRQIAARPAGSASPSGPGVDRAAAAAAPHTAVPDTATEGPEGNWPVGLLSVVLRGLRERRR